MVEVALATNTHPDQWTSTDDRLIATVLDVLAEQAEQAKRRTRKGR